MIVNSYMKVLGSFFSSVIYNVKPVFFRNLVRGFGTWFTVVGVYGLARATYKKHYREASTLLTVSSLVIEYLPTIN
jgi:hypothetical protein